MFNLSSIFNSFLSIFNQFEEILELLKKKDFPSEIKFYDPQTNNTIKIHITTHNNNEINFKIKLFKNKNQIDIIHLNTTSNLFFQNQYYDYLEHLLPNQVLLAHNSQKNYMKIFQSMGSFFKLSWKLINEFRIKPFFTYPFTLLNIYSIDGYNNTLIARTIMRSSDKFNIISNSNTKLTTNFPKFHNLNVILSDYIFQNRARLILKMFTLGTRFFISFIRLYLFIIGVIVNTTFISSALSKGMLNYSSLYDSIILPNLPLIIFDIVIPIIWFFMPKIIRFIITFRLQKGIKITQLN